MLLLRASSTIYRDMLKYSDMRSYRDIGLMPDDAYTCNMTMYKSCNVLRNVSLGTILAEYINSRMVHVYTKVFFFLIRSNSDKPAAIDVSITSPLKSNILSEAGVVAGAAARQTEERKHISNDTICSELGWKCVPLVMETFGAWGRTAGQFFGELASRLAAQSHSSKTIMLNNIYGRLSLTLVRANARARVATTMDLLEG